MARISLCVALLAPSAFVADSVAAKTFSRDEIRAAYLYNFFKFVTWPREALPGKDSSFNLCMVEVDSAEQAAYQSLDELSAKSRNIDVRHLTDLRDANSCHILFIGYASRRRTREILTALSGQPTLTASSTDFFTRNGGMIGLVSMGSRIILQINLEEVERAGLKISANMLEVGKIVSTK